MSSNNYIKNYGVGQVILDAPYAHFLYQLPLLSFSDVQHAIDLSLVYQSKMTDNLFHIAGGYKLSLQKRLIIPENSENPTHYIEDIGRKVNLFTYGSSGSEVYAFNDNSKRILRKTSDGFTLENPDYSKELFSGSGNILKIVDKYGNTLLTYNYETINGIEVLKKIIYREALTASSGAYKRVINLNYSSAAQLTQIQYVFDGIETYSISFSHSDSKMTVAHYTGVSYTLEKGANIFSAYSHDTGSNYLESIDHWQKTTCEYPEYSSLTVKSFIGSKLVDKVTYHPMASIADDKCEVWDVESFSGVRKRILFDGDFPKYSYEVTDVSTNSTPQYDAKFSYNDSHYGKISYYNNNDVVGSQCYDDGEAMLYDSISNKWSKAFLESGGRTGLFTITGWVKPTAENTSCIFSVYNQSSAAASEFTVKSYGTEIWTYFTHVVYGDGFTSINVDALLNSSALMTKDFRVTYQSVDLSSNDTTKHFINAEDVLIDSAGNIIPFRNLNFVYFKNNVYDTINGHVSAGDVLKYQMNGRKNGATTNEVYYDDVKGIITGVSELAVLSGGSPRSILSYTVGKRYDSKSKIYVTKLITNPPESNTWFKTQTLCDGTIISIELYDEYMNLLSSTKDGVTTTYERNGAGLVTKQITNDIIAEASYDTDFTRLLWSKDEFGTKTLYTTDEVFGVVTKSTVTDIENASVIEIEESFDKDFSDRESITFRKDSASNAHTFTYENDKIKTVTGDELEYSFSYEHNYTHSSTDSDGNAVSDSSDLVGISKCGSLIEQNVYKDDQRKVTTAYPSLASPLYTVVQRLDKYGRIEQIDGIVKNTYDALPYYSEYETEEFGTVGDSGETALLAVSEDLMTGKKTKFGYKADQLKIAAVFNSSGTKLTTESFEYDNINRMTSDEFTYETGKSVKSQIEYDTATTDINPDSRIKNYSYKVNGTEKVETRNYYHDDYKRLTTKRITVDNNKYYDKTYVYDKTRISSVRDAKNNSNYRNISYGYDALGRIISEADSVDTSFNNHYIYDSYGRLIQESNKALDKTFVFKYNDSGNILGCATFAYTTNDISDSAVTETHGYDAVIKDRLKSFNGSSISYDANGYPTSFTLGGVTHTLTWTKGKLTKYVKSTSLAGTGTYTYTYDGYGRRISKNYRFKKGSQSLASYITMASTVYTYDTSGRLVREKYNETYNNLSSNSRDIIYLYDESGIVGAVQTYNTTIETFYFDRNIKGDVIGIYNASGTQIAKYSYDSWGNCTAETLVTNNFSAYNPIRYRGYYFDAESELYFLNARYYNPAWRRFISPDDTAYLDPDTPSGLNLYAYCNNDPVNYADPSGHSIALVFLGTFVLGFGSSLLINAAHNGWSIDYRDVAQATVDGLFAVAATAIAMTQITFWGSVAAGAVLGFLQYVIGAKIQNEKLTLSGSVTAALLGAIGGAFSGAGASNIGNISDNLIGLSDDGARAIKAMSVAADRRFAGQISQKGLQGTFNLYGKVAYNAVLDATPGTIKMLFTQGAKKIAIYTPIANIISGGLNYVYNSYGWI